MPFLIRQDDQLSQRDRAAGCVIVLAKSGRLELGDNIYEHYRFIFTHCHIIGLKICRIRRKKPKICVSTILNVQSQTSSRRSREWGSIQISSPSVVSHAVCILTCILTILSFSCNHSAAAYQILTRSDNAGPNY